MTVSGGASQLHINVSELLDRSHYGPLQRRAFALCLLCLVIDGFDVQALGYTAPSIVREWHLSASLLGPVFAAGNFGVLVGALCCSMLADRIGRRPVLIGATIFFAAMTVLTARATSVPQMLILRLISGIGMGTIIPNACALVGEFSPLRLRATMIMIVSVGFTVGAVIGGFIANVLIPRFGWHVVFYFGGALPLALAVAMIVGLPESLQLMVIRAKDRGQLARWLKQIDPHTDANEASRFIVREQSTRGVPVFLLFREGRATATVLFWIINFMNLLNLYALSNWLAIVVDRMGHPTQAVLVSTTLQIGGTVGTFGLAWLVARGGFVCVMSVTFAIAAASIALIGMSSLTLPLLFAAVFIAGWCVVGSQPGLNALSGAYYPTYIRATGVGAGSGVGRVGAIVGPLLGGMLLGAHWSTRDMFLAAAVPAAVSAVAMLSLRWVIGAKLGATTHDDCRTSPLIA
jgi:AAHS family 4-hydroxybenzoate transporter-like MFS transporter